MATDDSSLSHLLSAILASACIDIKTCALQDIHTALNENDSDFELLIVDGDVTEPLQSGYIALVVISPSDGVATYDLGADMVVYKPLSANIFLAKVRSILRRYGIAI